MFLKWWGWFRQFPKFIFAATIILGSTAIFGIWLFTYLLFKPHPRAAKDTAAEQAAVAKQAAKAEARIDYLFLADDDLYDAGTGELIFKNWLHGEHPVRLFYDSQTKKIIGEFPEGFARYGFDGNREASMMLPQSPPAMIPGRKRVVFAKQKNIWLADIDWQKFEFVNQRQVTTMGVFYEQHFADNVQLLTDKTLVMRNLNSVLRVDLENGNVKQTRLPLNDIAKRRSPDSKWVVGVQNGQFYCYDVDADATKTIPVGRGIVSDFQWLGNERCLGLSGTQVFTYDRPAHTLTQSVTLPLSCFNMAEPSHDGRFIFCAGGMNGRNDVLVDLAKKTADRVTGGAGITWLNNNTFAFSRDIYDSNLRGTWLQSPGASGRRILDEPYLTEGFGTHPISLSRSGLIILITRKQSFVIDATGNIPTNWKPKMQVTAKLTAIMQILSR